jgi:hypothetical protein
MKNEDYEPKMDVKESDIVTLWPREVGQRCGLRVIKSSTNQCCVMTWNISKAGGIKLELDYKKLHFLDFTFDAKWVTQSALKLIVN